jgi:hypothetical protein
VAGPRVSDGGGWPRLSAEGGGITRCLRAGPRRGARVRPVKEKQGESERAAMATGPAGEKGGAAGWASGPKPKKMRKE